MTGVTVAGRTLPLGRSASGLFSSWHQAEIFGSAAIPSGNRVTCPVLLEEAGFLSTTQQFGTAAVVELIILICLIGWEVSRPKEETARPGGSDTAAAKPEQAIVLEPEPMPPRIEPPPRPKLVVSASSRPAGSVARILSGALEPGNGDRVEMEEIYGAYAKECARQGVSAVTPEEFVDPLKRFCRACRVTTKVEDGKVYLMNVRLTARAATSEASA